VDVRVEEVVTGLEVPWGMAFLPGGDILVTEQPGRVHLVWGGQLHTQPVATIDTAATGEGGVLGKDKILHLTREVSVLLQPLQ
jgi:aldose sugar dehydrogenase